MASDARAAPRRGCPDSARRRRCRAMSARLQRRHIWASIRAAAARTLAGAARGRAARRRLRARRRERAARRIAELFIVKALFAQVCLGTGEMRGGNVREERGGVAASACCRSFAHHE